MSRIKIILLILVVAALSIILIQNSEPVALKLLCGSGTPFCIYRSPSLPLGVWVGLFTLIGAIVNLLVQTLSSYGYRDSSRQKSSSDNDLYPKRDSWQSKTSRKPSKSTIDFEDSVVNDRLSEVGNYEAKQEPQNVERSGSTYSYKYREGDRSNNNNNHEGSKKISTEYRRDSDQSQEEDDGDWI